MSSCHSVFYILCCHMLLSGDSCGSESDIDMPDDKSFTSQRSIPSPNVVIARLKGFDDILCTESYDVYYYMCMLMHIIVLYHLTGRFTSDTHFKANCSWRQNKVDASLQKVYQNNSKWNCCGIGTNISKFYYLQSISSKSESVFVLWELIVLPAIQHIQRSRYRSSWSWYPKGWKLN